MKILVGTLYCGENEYDSSLASVKSQTYTNYDHIILKDLPNKGAHHTLFRSFLQTSEKYDLHIKVDADMVICSDTLFEKIVKRMTHDPNLDVFSIAVLDFFSGTLINGLNTYRNNVFWDYDKNTMFVDIPEVPPDKCYFDSVELAPAAIHCKNPSRYQAFHYGVHRGFKSIARQHSTTHWALLEKTWQNFLQTKDERIGLAILGAELVYARMVTKDQVDYTNPGLRNTLHKYETLNPEEIRREVKKLRAGNWGFLPGDLRRKLLRKKSLRESELVTSKNLQNEDHKT